MRAEYVNSFIGAARSVIQDLCNTEVKLRKVYIRPVSYTHLGYRSIDKWVAALKSFPLFAILSGFAPDDTPGVGTFYDFINRLWQTDNKATAKIRKPGRRRRRKGKMNEKTPLARPGIVGRLVNRILRQKGQPLPARPEDILNNIFQQVFVEASGQKGLLGDTKELVVAGDGTPVRTGASPYGKKICDCKKKGIFNCQCPRRYSDPEAAWGWDSYRECYFYGRHLYEITATSSPHDLPIYLKLVSAKRHDSVSFVAVSYTHLDVYKRQATGRLSGRFRFTGVRPNRVS